MRPNRQLPRQARLGAPRWAWGLLLATLSAPAFGAAYLRIEDVPGEARDPDHRGWIEVLSLQQALSLPTPTGGGSARAVQADDLVLRKSLDKASPKLAEAVCTGAVLPEIEIELVRPGPRALTFYRVVLKDVQIVRHATTISADTPPVSEEEIALTYASAEWTYTEATDAGRVLATHRTYWDFLRNEGGGETIPRGFRARAVIRPGKAVGIAWTAQPGKRYQLLRAVSLTAPFEVVQDIAAAEAGERWIELPTERRFAFFLLREVE